MSRQSIYTEWPTDEDSSQENQASNTGTPHRTSYESFTSTTPPERVLPDRVKMQYKKRLFPDKQVEVLIDDGGSTITTTRDGTSVNIIGTIRRSENGSAFNANICHVDNSIHINNSVCINKNVLILDPEENERKKLAKAEKKLAKYQRKSASHLSTLKNFQLKPN